MDYDRLRELQEKFEENPRRYFAPLANEYRKGGQPKRAIEICRAHLAQMPGHMSGQIVFGQSLFEAGEFEEARQVFERAIVLDPENLIALRSLGDMALQSGNTGEAREWYTRLLDADPKDTTVIALVHEIDAADEATPVTPQPAIPGIDADLGDQQIPWLEPPTAEQTGEQASPKTSATTEETAAPASASIKQTPHTEWAAATQSAPSEASAPAVNPPAANAPAANPPAVNSPAAVSPSPEIAAAAPAPATPMNSEVVPPGVTSSAPDAPPPPMPSEEANEYMASKVGSANPDVPEQSTGSPAQTTPEPAPPASESTADISAPLGLERHYPTAETQDEVEVLGITREQTPLRSQRIEKNPLEWTPVQPSAAIDAGLPPETGNTEPSQAERSASRPDESIEQDGDVETSADYASDTSESHTAETASPGATGDWFAESQSESSAQTSEDAGAQYTGAEVSDTAESDASAESETTGARSFSGASAEPFVNETMAQLYLQQGYRQLALQVYYRLAETRPNDQAIKDRIREIESADAAAGGGAEQSRGEDAEVERESSPIASHALSDESTARNEPRTQSQSSPSRQPSIKEFFATLGRRRPRSTASRTQSTQPDDVATPLAAAPPAPTLDNVFAGAEVSPADSRAASRLAGAFSGNPGTARTTTPRTPPVPTPRLNPRLQTQESEEDVAKFRAWLDGLTGE